MADEIQYSYPVAELDELIEQMENGILPMMSAQLKEEVALRRRELLQKMSDYEDDDDEYLDALERHKATMAQIEIEKRKSRSHNVIELDLTAEEQAEIDEDVSESYVRNDPNAMYHIPEDELSASAEEAMIRRKLESLGKVYYNQKDYANAINIIREAIEFSLRRDYPWLKFEEALQQFAEGKIRYTFAELPVLYINYNTQITDKKLLAGIVTGDVHLINVDDEPKKKRKKRSKNEEAVSVPYDIITPEEHAYYAQIHQAGFDTPISTILKSCSTVYGRYVMPPTLQFKEQSKAPEMAIDWSVEGMGEEYFNVTHNIQKNPISEIVSILNEANTGKLNQNIGTSLREFMTKWRVDQNQPQFVLSTSLEDYQQAATIESHILDMIRNSNPNI